MATFLHQLQRTIAGQVTDDVRKEPHTSQGGSRPAAIVAARAFALGAMLWLALTPAAWAQDLNDIFKQFEQHRQAGRYAEAERLGRQAVDACEARFGRDHPDCAWFQGAWPDPEFRHPPYRDFAVLLNLYFNGIGLRDTTEAEIKSAAKLSEA